ncbi:MAG: M20/M25/M40 family metallo-hydrolase [Bacillota bacterium]
MNFLKIKFVVLLLCLFCISVSAQIPAGYEKGLNSISKDEMYKSVLYLASDSLKGRPAGSEENLAAAKYIAAKFKQYGLKPLYTSVKKAVKKEAEEESVTEDDENVSSSELDIYLQKFNIKKAKLTERCGLALQQNTGETKQCRNYAFRTDFLLQYSGCENLNVTAPVVFAGYGIDKGEKGYSDYIDENGKELDVKNKIVVVADGYPLENDEQSIFSKSRNPLYRNQMRKADIARDKGALAMIIVSSALKNDPPINFKYEKSLGSFDRDIFSLPELERNDIPVFYINKNVITDILKGTGKDYRKMLESIDKTLKPVSFEVSGKNMSFEINFDSRLLSTQNVAGLIEGTDPELKNELIVVGAHYDHVGFGYYGAMNKENKGKIHNGADDNASGTAALIEIAEAFSKNPGKRSVLFLAFTGEENGMLGSKYYVNEQPLMPLNKTIAMLNLDMISRNNPGLLSVGGAFYSRDLIKIAERANEKTGFELLYNTGLLTSASDQAPFLRKEIPALFFFSGMHEDYHTPTDDIEKVNFEKAEKVAKLAYLTGWITANENEKPQYKNTTIEERTKIVRESIERQGKFEKNNKNNN